MKILLQNLSAPCNEIASNLMFHERIKHVKVNCHFVRKTVMNGKICTPFTRSENQTADIFTKVLRP